MYKTDSGLILLDCDDVLLDYLPGITSHALAHGIDVDPSGPGQFNMAPWLGLSPDETMAMIRSFNEGEDTGFDRLSPIPGAVEGVRALRAAGYAIRVLSSFSVAPAAISRRMDNLDRVFGADAFEGLDTVSLGSSKRDVLSRHPASPFVDDLLKNVVEAAGAGHSGILMRAHHNAPDYFALGEASPIGRVADWGDLLVALEIIGPGETFSVDNSELASVQP